MFKGLKIGVAITGSFCSLSKLFYVLNLFKEHHGDLYLILSDEVQKADTRFYHHDKLLADLKAYTSHDFIMDIPSAEKLGPMIPLDLLLVFPATSNTISKFAYGICDSPVLMACKATIRNQKPVVFGMFSNDALGQSANSWTTLYQRKHIYFVPFGQDDPISKPNSLVCDESKVMDTMLNALQNKQIQPLLVSYEKD